MASGLLQGKRGVIMGVANERSIAWACAKACEAEGASLVFSYPGEALEKRVRKLVDDMPGAAMFECDVRDDQHIVDFFAKVKEHWGSIDFVIHSIAYAEREDLVGRFIDTPRKNFLLALDVSAYSLVAAAREAEALMPNGGSILAMTFLGGERVMPRYNVMGVAKSALDMCMRYLVVDLGPKNIRVNCLSPGPVKTLSASAITGFKQMLDIATTVSPLRRVATPEEIAKSAVFMVSDAAAPISGEVFHIDAGYHVLGMFAVDPNV
jgi:enoyl-[acyl-carrier protein] reductase I